MNTPIVANANLSRHLHLARTIRRLQPCSVATQALCLTIVLLDLLGTVLGLKDFVSALWSHHPLLTILCAPAAILGFAALIEFGMECLRADPAQRLEITQPHDPARIVS